MPEEPKDLTTYRREEIWDMLMKSPSRMLQQQDVATRLGLTIQQVERATANHPWFVRKGGYVHVAMSRPVNSTTGQDA